MLPAHAQAPQEILSTPESPPPAYDIPGIAERRSTAIFKRHKDIAEQIRQLKNDPLLAETLGMRLVEEFRRANWDATLIVPVPLHPRKLEERGYNQAALLADVLARETGIAFEPERALERVKDSKTQRGKDKTNRLVNLEFAFNAYPVFCYKQRIVLVDDVVTSGATLEHCAAALARAGAQVVWAITVASGYITIEQQEKIS